MSNICSHPGVFCQGKAFHIQQDDAKPHTTSMTTAVLCRRRVQVWNRATRLEFYKTAFLSQNAGSWSPQFPDVYSVDSKIVWKVKLAQSQLIPHNHTFLRSCKLKLLTLTSSFQTDFGENAPWACGYAAPYTACSDVHYIINHNRPAVSDQRDILPSPSWPRPPVVPPWSMFDRYWPLSDTVAHHNLTVLLRSCCLSNTSASKSQCLTPPLPPCIWEIVLLHSRFFYFVACSQLKWHKPMCLPSSFTLDALN